MVLTVIFTKTCSLEVSLDTAKWFAKHCIKILLNVKKECLRTLKSEVLYRQMAAVRVESSV